MEWELIAEEFPSAKSGGPPRSVAMCGYVRAGFAGFGNVSQNRKKPKKFSIEFIIPRIRLND